ncbi:MAG: phage tail tape measure protein [Candidatus Humimicrobiaceae bacterium]
MKVDPTNAIKGSKKVKDALDSVENQANKTRQAISKSLSLIGVAAGVTGALNTIRLFSQEVATVGAVTNATEKELISLRNTAKELGASTRFSATEAAKAMTFLAKAGFSTSQVLASVEDTLKLAQAGALDLATAADIASNVLTGFRISTDEAANVVDILAFAANNANTNVMQLGDAMKFVAPVAAGLGVSIEDTTAALGALADAGLQASLGGTGLRRILSELESPANNTIKIFEKLKISTEDVKVSQVGLIQALEVLRDAGVDTGLALEIFGDRGGPAFAVLADALPKVTKMSEELKNVEGFANRVAAAMDDNLNGAFLSVISAVEAVILAFGDLGAESTLTQGFRALASTLRLLADNIGALTGVLLTGAAAWAAYNASVKASVFAAAITSTLQYTKAIATGSAVALGSAQAEAQKARAITAGIAVQVASTKATLAKSRAELANAVVVRGSTQAEFARIAMLKQVSILEAQLVGQKKALTAAQVAQTAAQTKAAGSLSKLSAIFPGLSAGMKAFTAAIAANPIGAIIVALTVVIGLLVTFSDKISLSSDTMATLGDVGTVIWERMSKALSGFQKIFGDVIFTLADIFEDVFGEMEFSLAGFINFAASGIDSYVGAWISAYNVILAVWEGFPAAIKDVFLTALNGAISLTETKINDLLEIFNQLFVQVGLAGDLAIVSFGRIENESEGAARDLGAALGSAIKQGMEFSGVSNFVTSVLDDAEKIAIEREKEAKSSADLIAKAVTETAPTIAAPTTEVASFQSLLDALKEEATLLKLTNSEREIQEGLLKIEDELKRSLTDTESDLVEARLRENQSLSTQASLYEQIKGPITEYKDTLEAVDALVKRGLISQEEYNAALEQTQLGQAVTGLQDELGGGVSPADQLALQLSERQTLIDQAFESGLIKEQEFLTLSLQINKDYNEQLEALEQARFLTQLKAGEATFAALSEIAKGYAGEQSDIYKGLFAASKAFAIAQTSIAIVQGIAESAKLGWPASIPAIAATIAQTAGLISQINSVGASGFQNGGTFKVGGAGGSDSQQVSFMASPNETVSVRTPGQERAAIREQGGAGTQAPEVNVTNVNVVDQNLLEDFLTSPSGDKVFMNAISRNQTQLRGVVGAGR